MGAAIFFLSKLSLKIVLCNGDLRHTAEAWWGTNRPRLAECMQCIWSRGFPADFGKHPSNVSYGKKKTAPMTITHLKVTNLKHLMCVDCFHWRQQSNIDTFERCFPSSTGSPRNVAIDEFWCLHFQTLKWRRAESMVNLRRTNSAHLILLKYHPSSSNITLSWFSGW